MDANTIDLLILVGSVLFVAIFATIVITMTVKDGSLQSDIRWVKRVARLHTNHYLYTHN